LTACATPDIVRYRYEANTNEEINLLKRSFNHEPLEHIAERLGRTPSAVIRQTYRLDLGQAKQRDWSPAELKLLRDLYPHKTREQIAARLNRSLNSLAIKAHQFGLKKQVCAKLRRSSWF